MSGKKKTTTGLDKILEPVEEYYSQKVKAHGPTAKGVDWNSADSQKLRFKQLLKVCDTSTAFSINDYGCGYGALVEYLNERACVFKYRGFDISEQMIIRARELHEGLDCCEFSPEESFLKPADYTVASGIFNVRLEAADEEWKTYIIDALEKIGRLSEKGFAANFLTIYSDSDRMRPDLYYADPCFLFDHCKKHFSRNVALLHDYDLYEFTILVRK